MMNWQPTEHSVINEDGTIACWVNRAPFTGKWHWWRRMKRGIGWMQSRKGFDTAEDAIAALEKDIDPL